MSNAKQSYKVLDPIKTGGKVYRDGVHKFDTAVGDELVAAGHCEAVAEAPKSKDDGKK